MPKYFIAFTFELHKVTGGASLGHGNDFVTLENKLTDMDQINAIGKNTERLLNENKNVQVKGKVKNVVINNFIRVEG